MLYTLKWLYPFWRKHGAVMTMIVAFGIVSAVLRTAIPRFIQHIIDGLSANVAPEYITHNALMIGCAGLLSFIINMTAQNARSWMNSRIELEAREMVFNHVMRLDRSFFHKYTPGDVLTRLMDDVQYKLSWFACSGVFRFVQASFTMLFVITMMLHVNPYLTAWALAPMPVLLVVYTWTQKRLNERFDAVQNAITEIYNMLEACFGGIRLIKANSKESCQEKIFDAIATKQSRAEISSLKIQAIFSSLFQYIGSLCSVFVYIGGGAEVIHGQITLGALIAFQIYSGMLVWMVLDVSSFVVQGKRAAVSIRRIDEMLLARPEVTEPHTPRKLPAKIKELKFSRAAYDIKKSRILHPLSFSAKAGQRVSVVGKIGSGKSTLLMLVPRLADASAGHILLDGEDLREFSLAGLRDRIGYVPQQAIIFSDTIRNNITLGRLIAREDFDTALRVAQLSEELDQFGKGLETMVGPRGATLSGGQKQRIALARAIVAKPQILLLDDCTSAMDADTEEHLWRDMALYMPGSICLFVTHRSKTIAASDLILTMDEGRIAEKGSHAELMALNGLYRKIYERQKLADEMAHK
jgi:ATP-binding cassette subfamily B protein